MSTNQGTSPAWVPNVICPLCTADRVSLWHADKWRQYLRCEGCRLIFVPAVYHLSPSDEKKEYDQHQNSPDDQGYRRFLSRIFTPIHARLLPASNGLDFGSGPGPTLSVMFEEVGHRMAIYDHFYARDASPLAVRYDFVTASEVVEHLRNPRDDLNRIWACVRPGGLLGIMTKLSLDRQAFARWHYKNDRTHISFFSRDTFRWLAARWNTEVSFVSDDVALFVKGSCDTAAHS